MDYQDFLRSKRVAASPTGFEPAGDRFACLFGFQRAAVTWAVRQGKAALFADTGLGKTRMQLAWADEVHRRTGGDVLILCPLAVAAQTIREGGAIGVPVVRVQSGSDVKAGAGAHIVNYERLGKLDPAAFAGVILDESSVLKNFTGSTKRAIIEGFARTPFKLACTATPAPNDHMELGNHAQFLDVMESTEMLSRWFINDTMQAGNYRLKRHAERDFWRWVASWAACFARPSDLGFPDDGFLLPPLNVVDRVVEVDLVAERAPGMLFRVPEMSATSMHREMRMTAAARASSVADLVRAEPGEPWLLWCNTDYEADELRAALPDAVEVRGSESTAAKERKLLGFADGTIRVLVTKPRVAGFGMNYQHCARMAFTGLSFSYEALYQSIRRCWRFGQKRPVDAHVVVAETEGRVLEAIRRKQRDHEAMKAAMVHAMAEFGLGADSARRDLSEYRPTVPMDLPDFLKAGAAS